MADWLSILDDLKLSLHGPLNLLQKDSLEAKDDLLDARFGVHVRGRLRAVRKRGTNREMGRGIAMFGWKS